MVYTLPEFVINEALTLENELNQLVPNPDFTFDFSKVRNFEPLPMLMMGAIMRRYRKKFPENKFFVSGLWDKTYAGTMGFFKYVSPDLDFGKEPGEASGSSNYIPITRISVPQLREQARSSGMFLPDGTIIEREASRLAKVLARENKELQLLLTYLIREILRNTPEHACTEEMWICGQYWNSRRVAEIAIIDEGIGIYESIRKNRMHREHITDNASAIQWAIKAGITQAFAPSQRQKDDDEWANSGFGLYMVSQICKSLNGNFALISNGNFLHSNNHGISIGNTSFHGTAIRIRIPSQNVLDAKRLIADICKQGESEAKLIRNAFKKASRPSRSLMDDLSIQ